MRDQHLIHRSFSAARMTTYEGAVAHARLRTHPFELYRWNMRVSGAFLLPLHTCEVVIRNAVAEAVAQQHGALWPWQEGFRTSLPGGTARYNAREELRRAASKHTSTAGVIASLRFAFWQHLFTQRFDRTLWSKTLRRVLPGADPDVPGHLVRAQLHGNLEQVRQLRNRIAHHEPIFARDLALDLATIGRIVQMRCAHIERWMNRHESVTSLLKRRPV
ncbi:hypothetical protein [Stenotrophomonas bentonitica]|uniref:hypothetical protein n=2 Tax=Lysobacteraceae TaxID=32033 RepID=UPI00142DEBF9|nr:hypothetical protein [Stenotrophomonas bentonitica]